jgi:hypothetical protein
MIIIYFECLGNSSETQLLLLLLSWVPNKRGRGLNKWKIEISLVKCGLENIEKWL